MTEQDQRSKLEDLRIEAGLSVTELSILARVSRDVITRCEAGQAIRGNIAGKICQALSIKLNRHIDYRTAEIRIV